MTEYKENFITTYTGKKFHYLDPQPDEIDITDIAHALSLTCRFSGHCKEFYSVAEHSIRVADAVPMELRLQALLHDAAEAYITDIPRPIKVAFGLEAAEQPILRCILLKYGLEGINSVIKVVDDILCATEARDLMSNTDDWLGLPKPLNLTIHPITSQDAERIYLYRFYKYQEGGA